ncbi:MAG: S41 family peptidase [Bdellovibrionales bacterium]
MLQKFVFILFFLTAVTSGAATPPQCAQALGRLNGVLEIALEKHAMFSKLDNSIVKRAIKSFINELDVYGLFFLEAERQQFLNQNEKQLTEIRQQVEKYDYQFFQQIHARFIQSFSRVQNYLSALPQKKETIVSRSQISDFAQRQANLKAVKIPKTLEEQNEKLIDWLADGYQDMLQNNYAPPEAFLLLTRLSVRRLEYAKKVAMLDTEELALKALLAGLDPHSTYLNPIKTKEFLRRQAAAYGGIGVTVREVAKGFLLNVLPGSPALEAGIQSGDLLTHVIREGKTILLQGTPPDDLTPLFRGPIGTSITVKVQRSGTPLTFSIVRGKVKTHQKQIATSVVTNSSSNVIGTISFTEFYKGSAQDFAVELKNLTSKNQLQGLILDLRNNGGGSHPDAMDIISFFINGGPGIRIRKIANQNTTFGEDHEIPAGQVIWNGPLMVLINEASASAAELVPLILKNHSRAIIAGGPRSFGKGTAQNTFPLSDPNGEPSGDAIKITEGVFFGPAGTTPNVSGLKPDVVLRKEVLPYGLLHRYPDAAIPQFKIDMALDRHSFFDIQRQEIVDLLNKKFQENKKATAPKQEEQDQELTNTVEVLSHYIQLQNQGLTERPLIITPQNSLPAPLPRRLLVIPGQR